MRNQNGGSDSRESIDASVAALASRQHGVFSRAQAIRLGATDRMVDRRLSAGRWTRLHPGVFAISGTPSSWDRDVAAACLTHQAAIASHRTAARLCAIEGPLFDPVEITLPRGIRRSMRGVMTYERSLGPWEITKRRGIRVTRPERTFFDVAPLLDPDVLENALDDAFRRGLITMPRMRELLERHAERGRDGVRIMRTLLEARSPGQRGPDSYFEWRLFRELRAAGLPLPLCQFEVFDGRQFVARVDFAYPAHRVAIEADSWKYHFGRRAWERDTARGDALMLLGWRIVHVTWRQLDRHPAQVTGKVARALALA